MIKSLIIFFGMLLVSSLLFAEPAPPYGPNMPGQGQYPNQYQNNVSPNVVVQASQGTVNQVKTLFYHSSYKHFHKNKAVKLFTISTR